jgi:ribulose-5-phosphate 4-epimerase/fuculose-1-phosphate aldolase
MTVKAPSRSADYVVIATRALAVAGIFDMHGHISVRDGGVFRINSHSASRIAVRREQVATVRIDDGVVLEGDPPSEHPIHIAIYRARADVGAVVHFHALYATSLAVAGKALLAAFNAGAPFGREVPVFDDPRLVRDEPRAGRLAAVLGRGRAAVLRGHGAVVAADDVMGAVALALELEESAHRLWLTYAIGEPKLFSEEELSTVASQLGEPRVVTKIWMDAIERARRAGALGGIDVETGI